MRSTGSTGDEVQRRGGEDQRLRCHRRGGREEGLLYKAQKEVSNQSVSLGGAQEMVSFSVLFLVSVFVFVSGMWPGWMQR